MMVQLFPGDIQSGAVTTPKIKSLLGYDVVKLVGGNQGFAALRSNGDVISWGKDKNRVEVLGGAKNIYANGNYFFAIKLDGSVHAWDSQRRLLIDGLTEQVSNVHSMASVFDEVDLLGNSSVDSAFKHGTKEGT